MAHIPIAPDQLHRSYTPTLIHSSTHSYTRSYVPPQYVTTLSLSPVSHSGIPFTSRYYRYHTIPLAYPASSQVHLNSTILYNSQPIHYHIRVNYIRVSRLNSLSAPNDFIPHPGYRLPVSILRYQSIIPIRLYPTRPPIRLRHRAMTSFFQTLYFVLPRSYIATQTSRLLPNLQTPVLARISRLYDLPDSLPIARIH